MEYPVNKNLYSFLSNNAFLYAIADIRKSGKIKDSYTSTAPKAINNYSAIPDDVKSTSVRTGNLSQSQDSISVSLNSAITDNTAAISDIFDADAAAEQINASKDSIANGIAIAMPSELNSSLQDHLTLCS